MIRERRPWVNKQQRVIDILADIDDIGVVTITENGVGHAYFSMEEIDEIPCDLMESIVVTAFVVKKSYGFHVEMEV